VRLSCGRFKLALDRPLIMGVVNVTPDSFYDGGRYAEPRSAIAHARRLIEEGADLLDIGGESSRPGAESVAVDEELARVLPVLEDLRAAEVPISIDTTKPAVMRAALDRGAAMINDIAALASPGALDIAASSEAAVCLMHMQGDPRTMQANPTYADVVVEVREFLLRRADACLAAGIHRDRIVLDPGFGFGKTVAHNLQLLARLDALAELGFPILAGLSRKSSLGRITGQTADDRLIASVTAGLLAVQRGAKILRVHDVAETRAALAVLAAVEKAN
jgi:dihydropteroate synthase